MLVKFLCAVALIHVCHGQEVNFSYLKPSNNTPPSNVNANCPEPSPDIVTSYVTKFVYPTTEALRVIYSTKLVTSTSTTTSTSTSTSIIVETEYTPVPDNYLVVTPVFTNTLVIHTSSIPNQIITSYTALIKPKYTQLDSEEIVVRTTPVYEVRFGTSMTTARHTTNVVKRLYTVEHEKQTVYQPKKTKVHFTTTTLRNTTNIVLPQQTITHLKTVVKHVTQTEYVVPPPVLETKTWKSFEVSTEYIKSSTLETSTITNTMTQFFEVFTTITMKPTEYRKITSEATYLFPKKPTKYIEISTELTRSEFSNTVSPEFVPTSQQTSTRYIVRTRSKTVPGIPVTTLNLEEVTSNSLVQYSHVITSVRETTVFSTDVKCNSISQYRYGEPVTRRDYLS